MIRNVSVDDAIEFLNELVELDRQAVTSLVLSRIPCNEAIAEHPAVQVGGINEQADVGLLGILNGMFGVLDDGEYEGWGAIKTTFTDGKISHFGLTDDD